MKGKPISALMVSKYLLSLDPRRDYFSRNHSLIIDNKDGYRSKPTIGNFRLNKMLQIIQALYYSCHKEILFSDEITAFEHGGIVYNIYRKFLNLHQEEDYVEPSLTKKQKNFIFKAFSYLRDNYNDCELRELAHMKI